MSGLAAEDCIGAQRFAEAGIELAWKDYAGYPSYPQRTPPFERGVSVLDMLFNVEPDAPRYIWGWRSSSGGPGRKSDGSDGQSIRTTAPTDQRNHSQARAGQNIPRWLGHGGDRHIVQSHILLASAALQANDR